eukprot:3545340-Pyramimonas_sp.AAC.1
MVATIPHDDADDDVDADDDDDDDDDGPHGLENVRRALGPGKATPSAHPLLCRESVKHSMPWTTGPHSGRRDGPPRAHPP